LNALNAKTPDFHGQYDKHDTQRPSPPPNVQLGRFDGRAGWDERHTLTTLNLETLRPVLPWKRLLYALKVSTRRTKNCFSIDPRCIKTRQRYNANINAQPVRTQPLRPLTVLFDLLIHPQLIITKASNLDSITTTPFPFPHSHKRYYR
jgi:hypothetical protein